FAVDETVRARRKRRAGQRHGKRLPLHGIFIHGHCLSGPRALPGPGLDTPLLSGVSSMAAGNAALCAQDEKQGSDGTGDYGSADYCEADLLQVTLTYRLEREATNEQTHREPDAAQGGDAQQRSPSAFLGQT